MVIHGWSKDRQSNSSVRGYSDIGGIRVTIHGWSWNCQSNSSVGYRGGSRTFLMVGLNTRAYRARENNYVLETTLTN